MDHLFAHMFIYGYFSPLHCLVINMQCLKMQLEITIKNLKINKILKTIYEPAISWAQCSVIL